MVLFAALAGLAYEAGKPGDAGPMFTKQVQYVITTLTKPAVAIPLASVIVLAMTSMVRRLRFERLVFKPGPIFVRELAVAPGVTDIDLAHLTTLFRGRLMQLRLHAAAPVPGATPAEDFLSVLDSEHLDAKNMLGSVVSILRAALPTHAYEVSVTLTQQDAGAPGKPRLGVTAQLTRLPNEAVPIETAWAYSWDEAVMQAADMVTAAVLPRTHLSNRPPWSGWKRYQMPGLVVHSYEKAQELTSARRYDEALSHCFQALELDPKSVDLRLCKGFIEEKLGLYMDAVATYAAARRVADKTARRLYNRKARRNRKASGRIATYRLVVLLSGIRFAHQWRKPKQDSDKRRDVQRLLLRERLSPELQRLLEHHNLLPTEPAEPNRKHHALLPYETKARARKRDERLAAQAAERDHVVKLLDEHADPEVDDDDDLRYYELRHLLAQLAASELSKLQRSVSWRRSQPGSLTPLSVKLTAAAVRLRLRYIEHRQAELEESLPPSVTPLLDWNPQPEVSLGRLRRSFQTWTEEYSAASLYALPLLVKPYRPPDDGLTDERRAQVEKALKAEESRRTELAKVAVEHLKRAMSSTPSWHAAERRDWVLSEDPDLDGLRACLSFKHFETIFFPSPAPTPRRPRRASRWEMSRYTNALLAETARRWEAVWHQRRDLVVSKIDPHVVIQWSKDEASAWQIIDRMARDYRHWPARCELIEQMNVWSARYGFEPLSVALPRFVRDNGMAYDSDQDYEAICKDVEDELAGDDERLMRLLERLSPVTGSRDTDAYGMARPQEHGAVVTPALIDVLGAQQFNGPSSRTGEKAEQPDVASSRDREERVWSRFVAQFLPGEPPLRPFQRLQDELSDRDFWHRAAPKQFLESVCDVHAAMWQRLHEWLEAPAEHNLTSDAHFTCSIAQAARLSETSGVRWISAVLARRIQRLSSGDGLGGQQATNGVPTQPTSAIG